MELRCPPTLYIFHFTFFLTKEGNHEIKYTISLRQLYFPEQYLI